MVIFLQNMVLLIPQDEKGGKKTTFAKKASNDLKCSLDHGFHSLTPPPGRMSGGQGKGVGKKQHLLKSLEMT